MANSVPLFNPFGDTISNGYDQDPASASSAYKSSSTPATTRTMPSAVSITPAGTLPAAQFTSISTANYQLQRAGRTKPITGVKFIDRRRYYPCNQDRYHVRNRQVRALLYARLRASPLADDSTLHCGDCHTVGQWKPGVTTNAAGVLNTVAIGAHGSNNEYLLRNSIGDRQRSPRTRLVCYLTCHKDARYATTAMPEYGSVLFRTAYSAATLANTTTRSRTASATPAVQHSTVWQPTAPSS